MSAGLLEEAWDGTFRTHDEELLIAALSNMGLRLATREAVLEYDADMFASPLYGKIWGAARKLAADSKLFTPANMRGLVSTAEERTYESLVGTPVREVEFTKGLALVAEAHQKRQLLTVLKQVAARAGTDDYGTALGYAHELVASLEGVEVASGSTTLQDTIAEFWDEVEAGVEQVERFATPWPTLNDKYLRGGHRRGQLVTWMAVSGGGKSVALLQEAGKFIRDGLKTAVFSLEMDRTDVTNRLLASQAEVSSWAVEDRKLDDVSRERLEVATDALLPGACHIFDATDLTVSEMRQQCNVLKRTAGLDVVVIDYIQAVQPDSGLSNREREVAEIVRQMKSLAMALDVVVLSASQMNESSERPSKGSVRESRAITHYSDVVLALHHERNGEVDMHVVKNRRGPESDGLMMLWVPSKSLVLDLTA